MSGGSSGSPNTRGPAPPFTMRRGLRSSRRTTSGDFLRDFGEGRFFMPWPSQSSRQANQSGSQSPRFSRGCATHRRRGAAHAAHSEASFRPNGLGLAPPRTPEKRGPHTAGGPARLHRACPHEGRRPVPRGDASTCPGSPSATAPENEDRSAAGREPEAYPPDAAGVEDGGHQPMPMAPGRVGRRRRRRTREDPGEGRGSGAEPRAPVYFRPI